MQLVVVDQNEDNRLKVVVADAKLPFPKIHLRSKSGLSHARNVGLRSATGDVISFPDDDCWYPQRLLGRVVWEFQSSHSVDGLTDRSEDGQGQASGGRFSRDQGRVDLNNVWERGISYTIFLRSSVCGAVGLFDEELGVGTHTPFGSGEQTDYLIRTIKSGFNIQYLPDLVVFHPNPILYTRNHRSKAFQSLYRFATDWRCLVVAVHIANQEGHLSIARGRVCGLWSQQQR